MASLGQALREEREARNISIEEIASSTKIVARYLEALEADHLDQMPGGFFVRGIIRSYAKAIGLDPETVLTRYKDAGLLEPSTAEKRVLPPLAAKPASKTEPAATTRPAAPAEPSATSATTRPSATTRAAAPPELAGPAELTRLAEPTELIEAPPPAAEPELAAEPEPAGGPGQTPHAVQYDEAPKPRLSDAARKRVLAWAWRVVAAAALVAVVLLIWPHKPREAGQTPAGAPGSETANPPAVEVKTDAPAAAPSGAATAQGEPAPSPAAAEAAPAEEAIQGLTIEITFQAETWIQVRADGAIKIDGLFPPGATARAQADAQLLIHTGNAGGFTLRLNGRPAKPLGRSGQVLTDIKINLDNLKDYLESPSSGAPTG